MGFQEVRKQALELVLELGPLFEEVEKEKVQEKDESKVDMEDKRKKHALLQSVKEPRT